MDDTRPALTNPVSGGTKTALRKSWLMAAWITGAFVLLLAAAMLVDDRSIRLEDPLKSVRLKEMRQRLQTNPTDEKMMAEIRRLDLELRTQYFRHLLRRKTGAYLLIAGACVFIVVDCRIRRISIRLPLLAGRPNTSAEAERTARKARLLVASTGIGLAVLLLTLGMRLAPDLPKGAAEIARLVGTTQVEQSAGDEVPFEEYLQNWPRFRGPDGGGDSLSTDMPTTGPRDFVPVVVWKAVAPAGGFNSPIVWGERVYFCGGTDKSLSVFCLNGRTGQEMWRREISASTRTPATEPPASSGYAAPTMASDGRRVYALFGNGDLAGLTMDGELAWLKKLGPIRNPYGHSSSLVTWRGQLILQLDQGEKEDGRSKLYAFDGRTGQTIWQRPRSVGSSWATPMVIEVAGNAQVITLAVPCVVAYAATDGSELWRVEGLNGEVTPSPVYSAGLVIAVSPSEKLLAIRPNGTGDVTKSHVAWTAEEGVPDITSPTSNGELIFTVTTSGTVTCFDAKDGAKQWEHDYGLQFHSSPAIQGPRLYLVGQKGAVLTLEVTRKFQELARLETGDEFHASPSFMRQNMILRGETNIWCLGQSVERMAGK
jgi:outer membrane protein assembly factor BamB